MFFSVKISLLFIPNASLVKSFTHSQALIIFLSFRSRIHAIQISYMACVPFVYQRCTFSTSAMYQMQRYNYFLQILPFYISFTYFRLLFELFFVILCKAFFEGWGQIWGNYRGTRGNTHGDFHEDNLRSIQGWVHQIIINSSKQ